MTGTPRAPLAALAASRSHKAPYPLKTMISALARADLRCWRFLRLAALLGCATLLWADPPLNDDFANRTPLFGPTNHVSATNVESTRQPGEPSHLKIPTDASVWWSWTAPDSGTATIDTAGSDFDTAVAVYTGSALSALELVAENDDITDHVLTSRVSFQAIAGTDYQIVVDGPYGASGNIALGLELPVTPSLPAIVTQPKGLVLVDRMGSNAVFRVSATGSAPLVYQWQLEGTNLLDATSPELTIGNVVLSDAGAYRVVVSNAWGWTVSADAVLKVVPRIPNDRFVDRIRLYGPTNIVTGSTAAATREPGEPNHLKMPAGHSIWWSWLAPDSGQATLSTAGSDFDTTLSVYTGAELGSLALVAKNDDADADHSSLVSFPVIGGVEYQIAVDGSLEASGLAVLTVALPVEPAPPRIVRQPRSLTVGDGGQNHAVFDAVITGSYPRAYQWQRGVEDLPGATEERLTLSHITLDDDGLYRLIVTNAWGTAISSYATLGVEPPLPNDYFGNRLFAVGLSTVMTGSLAGATTEPDEPSHSDAPGGHSAWWSWIAPANGLVRIQGSGTNLESFTLAVYTGGALGGLVRVASGTNDHTGSQPARASIEFWVAAGTAYQIAADGDWNQDLRGSGGVSLVLLEQSDSTAVANDNFAGRFLLIGPTNNVTGSNANATREFTEPEHLGMPAGASVWWTWIAPENGPATIDTRGSGYDTTLSVYTGETLADLSLVAENDDDGAATSGVSFQATAGTAYQIAVDGFLGANGDVALNVALPVEPAAPMISTQPLSQVQVDGAGGTATFGVEVTGSYPRFYQWRLDDVDLPGATRPELTVTGVVLTNAGKYSVVVTNAWGAATSSNATLTVISPISNDTFAGRILISGSSHRLTGSNVGAGLEPGEPRLSLAAVGQTLWWSWTAPADGLVGLDTVGSSCNAVLGVYSGSTLEALSLLAASPATGNANPGSAHFRAVAGTAYQIQVDGYNSTNDRPAAGDIVVNLTQFPNNDFFANALAVAPDATAVFDSNVGATSEAGEPNHGGHAAGHSVWWSWTATQNRVVLIDTRGSSFPALLAVYTGGALETLRLVDEDDNSRRDGVSRIRLLAAAGAQYRIAVDGSTDAGVAVGDVVLNINWDLQGVSNDNFADRISLAGQTNVLTASNLEATSEPQEPSHAGDASSASVWWSWVAPLTGPVTISTFGSDFDTRLAVYTGTAVSGLTPVAQNDDYDPATPQSKVEFAATAGTEYEIAVDGYLTDQGAKRGLIRLNLSQPTPPVEGGNDNLANRFTLSGGAASATGSNVRATKEQGEPDHAGNPGGRSLWWSWRAPAAGSVTIDTLGSSFPTLLAIYTGADVQGLTLVGADNGGGTGNGTVTFLAEEGTDYLIAVDGYSQGTAVASGAVVLSLLEAAGGGSANDNFDNRSPFLPFVSTARGSNVGATSERDEPSHAGLPAGASVWWSWTASQDGPVTIDTSGSGFDTRLAVYTGASVSSLELVAANDDIDLVIRQSRVRFQAAAGTEYQIAVDGYGLGIGSILLDVRQETGQLGAPVITQQPVDQSRFWNGTGGGANVLFRVVATGEPPLAYQWRVNGTDIPGETSSTLVVPVSWPEPPSGTPPPQARLDFYSVRITNAVGDVSSTQAALRLLPYAFNDNFADGIDLRGFTNTVFGSCLTASNETSEPNHANSAGGQSVWWSWVAPSDWVVSMDTLGSSADTVLAVYTGANLDFLSLVAANDDIDHITNSASRVEFQTVKGVEYHIAVDVAKTNDLSGSVVLHVGQLEATPPIAVLPGSLLAGSPVVLEPQLSDAPSSWLYQWFVGDQAIPGANQKNLVFSSITRTNSGTYKLVISNGLFPAGGSVSLRVQAPQRIRSLRFLPDGKARLSFSDPDGALAPDTSRLEVHSTAAFEGPNTIWQTNTAGIFQSEGLLQFEEPFSATGQRFYRVIER